MKHATSRSFSDTDSAATPEDEAFMRQAIALSRDALYVPNPNPRVACLIVRDGQVLASGVTQAVGGPHAEVMALRQAAERGVQVDGATVYVTLEPCSHFGRTPPCVDALVAAQPARVVVALFDPNPLVSGQGLARLRAAGIAVTGPVCAAEALEINPGFVARMTRKTPWVWLKSAASLDGRIALENGQSQWITGSAARADGHHWRARSCVVLTGLRTVLADDPQLNVRAVQTPRQPIRAVIDTRFEIPETARIFDGGKVWVFTSAVKPEKAQRLGDRQVQVVTVPAVNGRVDLQAVMQWMGAHQINEVHVEAGAALHGALLQADLVDELLAYVSPKILGAGRPLFDLAAFDSLSQSAAFRFLSCQLLGDDMRLRLRRPDSWQPLLNSVLGSAATGA